VRFMQSSTVEYSLNPDHATPYTQTIRNGTDLVVKPDSLNIQADHFVLQIA
jgi:hypothetical protein